MSLEGIISKRGDAPYVSRRDGSWLKCKCGMRQEFVIIGYTDPKGARTGFGALLLGYFDDRKRLTYAGRVGTGFDERMLVSMHRVLVSLEQSSPPTHEPPPARERRHAHWVKPRLVGEVRFSGWTRDGLLRHPAFVALRTDKPAAQIVREVPVPLQRVTTMSKSTPGNGSVSGVALSHPDKLLFKGREISKRDLAEYYESAARWMLPHV